MLMPPPQKITRADVLGKLLLRNAERHAAVVEEDRAAGCRALIERKHAGFYPLSIAGGHALHS